MDKPKRLRIYKLSTFDAFTEEERALNEAYKKAGINDKATLKNIRDQKIASYEGIRKIERKKLYTYKYDKNRKAVKSSEEENINKQIAMFENEMIRYVDESLDAFPLVMEIVYMRIDNQVTVFEQILRRGLLINDQKYIVYTSTTNQMKNGEFVLIQEDFYNENQGKFMCGLTDDVINQKGGCNTGKYLAYKGLPLSSSIDLRECYIDIEKCLVVPDFKTVINEEVDCIDIEIGRAHF